VKISFLSFYNGQARRGAETFVHELANHLTLFQHQIIVFQHGPPLPESKYSVQFLSSLTSLPSNLGNPDILFPLNGRIQSIQARIWTLTHGKKLVISGQSGLGLDDRLNLYTFPDAFVGLTDFQCDWAKKANPFVRVIKIPNGVDLAKFRPDVPPIKVDLPRPLILYVAALEPIKRHKLLIQATANTSASLLLVGQGSLYHEINSLGRKLLGPKRFQIASYPYPQMPQVFRSCDIFAYPTSPWESFGIAILEALASGLPVVGSNDPIRKEIIGPAGILVDPTNIAEFSRALSQGLEINWGDKPQVQAQKFSWDNIAKMYSDLFNRFT
jgi:glycosyltransferase involved in cell wall biosynthesis